MRDTVGRPIAFKEFGWINGWPPGGVDRCGIGGEFDIGGDGDVW